MDLFTILFCLSVCRSCKLDYLRNFLCFKFCTNIHLGLQAGVPGLEGHVGVVKTLLLTFIKHTVNTTVTVKMGDSRGCEPNMSFLLHVLFLKTNTWVLGLGQYQLLVIQQADALFLHQFTFTGKIKSLTSKIEMMKCTGIVMCPSILPESVVLITCTLLQYLHYFLPYSTTLLHYGGKYHVSESSLFTNLSY